jgi:hypothetical protein
VRADGGTLERVRDLPQDRNEIFDRNKECGVQGVDRREQATSRPQMRLPLPKSGRQIKANRSYQTNIPGSGTKLLDGRPHVKLVGVGRGAAIR